MTFCLVISMLVTVLALCRYKRFSGYWSFHIILFPDDVMQNDRRNIPKSCSVINVYKTWFVYSVRHSSRLCHTWCIQQSRKLTRFCVSCLPRNISLRQYQCVNSSPPSAAYMRQWTGPSSVQVMACRLFGAKPLPEPMMAYCQLDSWEQSSAKFESELYDFHSRKCILTHRLPKWRPFCPGEIS